MRRAPATRFLFPARVPLRVRLTLAFAVAMAIVMAGLSLFVYWRVGHDLLSALDLSLRARAENVAAAARAGRPVVSRSSVDLADVDEAFTQILDPSGRVLEGGGSSLEKPVIPSASLRSVSASRFLVKKVPEVDGDPLRLLVLPASSSRSRFVVVGATLGDRQDALARLGIALAVGGPVALALTSFVGWVVAGAALRPVEAMRREAEAISLSEPERRLPVPETKDELARLGSTLNSMLDRLQESFERERRFVDDASHELRTPLTVLKTELDLALAHARTRQELEDALRSAAGETDRLVRLAEDLLVLARANRGRLPVHRSNVSLMKLLAGIAASHANRARAAGATIALDVQDVQGETASLDAARVRQAVENLLENAIRHSGPGGVIKLRAGRSDGMVAVSVEDDGPGFAPDLLERAFEPFVRSESGAAGANGWGAGLGLAIVRSVAEGHGGRARAENVPDGGARVTVTLRG